MKCWNSCEMALFHQWNQRQKYGCRQVDTQNELSNVDPDDEEEILKAANNFAEENGFSSGEFAYEIYNGNTNEPSAVLDLAWPDGCKKDTANQWPF